MQTPEQLAAERYNLPIPHGDAAIDFYPEPAQGQLILEVACETGRVVPGLARSCAFTSGWREETV